MVLARMSGGMWRKMVGGFSNGVEELQKQEED